MARWVLFFLICAGLGYPTLNRYDPRSAGNLDAAEYYRLVEAWPLEHSERGRYRVLVPLLAKPFYWLANGRVGSWDPGLFGLLAANAIFCASTASLLVGLGRRALGEPAVALLGAALFLLNFAVANLLLSGMVDSAEAFALTALAWALLHDRLWLVALLGPIGALAKETFVPLGLAFGLGWHVATRDGTARPDRVIAVGGMALAGLGTLVLLHSVVAGEFQGPWRLADLQRSQVSYLSGLVRSVGDRGFWYVFGWLLPLGLPVLGRLPRPWIVASACAGVVGVLLGAWVDSQGNAGRPVFDAAGPLLSLSAASLLARPPGGP